MSIESQPKPFIPHPRKLYASLIGILGGLFVFYQTILLVSRRALFPDLAEAFHVSMSDLQLISTGYFYACLLSFIPAGILIDKYGIRHPNSLAIIICAIGALIFGLSPNVTVSFYSRILIGIGGCFSVLTVLKLSLEWFSPLYFASLNGLVMSFGMAGALFGETPFNSIFNFFTWRITFLDLALFGFILGILYWIFVRDPSTFENIKLPSQSPPFKKTF
ncbi:MAG: MFS transporter, partial [Chlamydiia bacterium]|nr:MFS transporter [Chlamydiia bacterium]